MPHCERRHLHHKASLTMTDKIPATEQSPTLKIGKQMTKEEELATLRQLLTVITADTAQMQRFFERMQRGDPRICKPEYSNPRYHEKFGYAE